MEHNRLPAHIKDLPKLAMVRDTGYAWQPRGISASLLLHVLRGIVWYFWLLSKAIASVVLAVLGWTLGAFGLCKDRRRVLLLGLDNSGKTALCSLLLRRQRQPRPCHHVLHSEFEDSDCIFSLIDPSCHERGSDDLWSEILCSRPQAIVFIVDAADRSRLPEAAQSLHRVLQHPAACKLPVLILGNKVDLKQAVDEWELKRSLGLAGLCREQRSALLGDTREAGEEVVLPRDLRQRIANFHPDEALSLPHGGSLTVQMCSMLKQKAAVSRSIMAWVSSHAECTPRSTSSTRVAEQLLPFSLLHCMSGRFSFTRHAATLPLWNHYA